MASTDLEPNTRLVLLASATTMNRDGTRCRVGARRLAQMTGLSKNTVAVHRLRAIAAGWLLPPTSGKHATTVEWLPSTPASRISTPSPQIPALSQPLGQCSKRSLSQSGGVTVPMDEPQCPNRWDKPFPTTSIRPSAHARERAGGLARLRQKQSPPEPPSPEELRRKVRQLHAALPDLGSADIARQLQADPSAVIEILKESAA